MFSCVATCLRKTFISPTAVELLIKSPTLVIFPHLSWIKSLVNTHTLWTLAFVRSEIPQSTNFNFLSLPITKIIFPIEQFCMHQDHHPFIVWILVKQTYQRHLTLFHSRKIYISKICFLYSYANKHYLGFQTNCVFELYKSSGNYAQ